jgi:hypothetical protein
MKFTILDLYCLNAICDDYENVASVTADVRRSAHGNVSDNEIKNCLIRLKKNGWASAYEFDSTRSLFNRVDYITTDCSDVWFFITDAGRKELDKNWVDG